MDIAYVAGWCLRCCVGVLHAAQAVVVKIDRPVPLDQPDHWPVIAALQDLATSGGEAARWTVCFAEDRTSFP